MSVAGSYQVKEFHTGGWVKQLSSPIKVLKHENPASNRHQSPIDGSQFL